MFLARLAGDGRLTQTRRPRYMSKPGRQIVRKTTNREIKHPCERIAREFHPEKIILFGSHAYGKPQWDSDVDLLIIMPFKGSPHRQAVNIRSRIKAPMALDLLIRTPEEISKRLEMEDFFIRETLERGKVMYDGQVKATDTQSP
jgi:predicted nucleotidyltransferase